MNLFAENGWLGWIIIGGIAGALAKLLMPGTDGGGIIRTVLLGVAGAMLSGLLGTMLGWYRQGEGPGFIAALIGALLLLVAYRQLTIARARS